MYASFIERCKSPLRQFADGAVAVVTPWKAAYRCSRNVPTPASRATNRTSGIPLTADQHIQCRQELTTHSKAANPRADKALPRARGIVCAINATTLLLEPSAIVIFISAGLASGIGRLQTQHVSLIFSKLLARQPRRQTLLLNCLISLGNVIACLWLPKYSRMDRYARRL